MKIQPAVIEPKQWNDLFTDLRNNFGRMFHPFLRVIQNKENNPVSTLELETVKPTAWGARDIQDGIPMLNRILQKYTNFPFRLGMVTPTIRSKRAVMYRPGTVCFYKPATVATSKEKG